MGFVFQVIEVAAWMFGYFLTVPLRSILRTMIFCPFRLSPWSPWLIKFRDPTAACTGTDDDALLKVDTPVWSYHLISAFGGGGLADTTFGLYPGPNCDLFFLWPLFQCTFFHGAVVCFLLPNIIGLLALYTWLLYSFHHFPVIFFIYFWFIFLDEF